MLRVGLKERLATVVEEYNLVVEEQGGLRRGRGCRDQIVSLMPFGQTKLLHKRVAFRLCSWISVRLMTECAERSCGSA